MAEKKLVLIGGGHSHILLLKKLGMKPIKGLNITLITPEPELVYTVMLPAAILGSYSFDQINIDLIKLKSLGFGFTGSSTASGEFSHGFAMITRKSGIGGPAGNYQTVVTTPGIFDGVPSGESGTYYRIRYAGATTYDVNTTHLMSESDI